MPEEKAEKKKTNPLVFIGIGCLVLLVLVGIGMAVAGKFFAKKIGEGFIETAIEQKTGIKTDIQDLEKGKMTFTDEKTGATVDVGSGKIPENFPSDFPLYQGVKVTSALSGAESGKNNGFWISMTTGDSQDKVSSFYTSQLKAKGWEITSTFTGEDTTTHTMKKGTWTGSVAISRPSDATETDIVVILGQEE